MMAAAADESIKLSIEETDGFINLSRGKTQEGRNEERSDGAAESPNPSRKLVTDQMRGSQSYEPSRSVVWRNVTKNLRQICQIIWKRLHRLYRHCSEDPTVCNLLVLVLKCYNCKLTITMPWPILRFGHLIASQKTIRRKVGWRRQLPYLPPRIAS